MKQQEIDDGYKYSIDKILNNKAGKKIDVDGTSFYIYDDGYRYYDKDYPGISYSGMYFRIGDWEGYILEDGTVQFID